MKRYGNLFEEVVSFDNLVVAAKRAFRSKKDKTQVAQFYYHRTDFRAKLCSSQLCMQNRKRYPQGCPTGADI